MRKKTIRKFKAPTPENKLTDSQVIKFVPDDISHVLRGTTVENSQYDLLITECKQKGMTIEQTATELEISPFVVTSRLQALRRAEILAPKEEPKDNLDLHVTLQFIADRLYWIFTELKEKGSWKMQLETYDRILKGIELAGLIEVKVEAYKHQHEFYEQVMGLLETEIPGATVYIRNHMKEVPLARIESPLLEDEEPVDLDGVKADTSLVATLGLGKEIVNRRKSGMTYAEIAAELHISAAQVSTFCQKYSKMSQVRKKQVTGQSIFDVRARLQQGATDLFAILEEIQKTDEGNMKFELFTMDRLFRLIELAAEALERTEVLADQKRFQAATLSLIAVQKDGVKARALKKLSDFQQGTSLLRPR